MNILMLGMGIALLTVAVVVWIIRFLRVLKMNTLARSAVHESTEHLCEVCKKKLE